MRTIGTQEVQRRAPHGGEHEDQAEDRPEGARQGDREHPGQRDPVLDRHGLGERRGAGRWTGRRRPSRAGPTGRCRGRRARPPRPPASASAGGPAGRARRPWARRAGSRSAGAPSTASPSGGLLSSELEVGVLAARRSPHGQVRNPARVTTPAATTAAPTPGGAAAVPRSTWPRGQRGPGRARWCRRLLEGAAGHGGSPVSGRLRRRRQEDRGRGARPGRLSPSSPPAGQFSVGTPDARP